MQLRLRLWHASVFFDEHAFEMPEFRITGDPSKPSLVLAYGPTEISPNIRNASNYITHFSKAGDFARYKVNVLKEGRYDIRIEYELGRQRSVQMEFDPDGEGRKLTFSPGQKSILLDNIYLAGGVQDWYMTNMTGNRDDGLKIYRYICSSQDP
jgi:hypothetical protein